MSEINNAMNLMYKSMDATLNTVNTALDILNMFISPLEKDPVNRVWEKAIDEGKADVITGLSEDDKKKFLEELKSQGIAYKDCGDMVFTLAANREKVEQILKGSSVITLEQQMENDSKSGLIELTVDSTFEAQNISSRLDQNNVSYTVNKSGYADAWKFVLSDKDYAVLDAVKRDVAIDSSQKDYAEILKREYDKQNDYFKECSSAMGSHSQDTIYIVDKDTVICSDAKTVTISKDSKKDEVIYKDDDMSKAVSTLVEMKSYAMLTSSEYEEFSKLDDAGKEKYIDGKRKEAGLGALTNSEKEIVIKAELQRNLIEQKLNEQHPAEVAVDANDYNNEQPLSLFTDEEKQNYESQHDAAESQHVDGTILNDAAAEYKGYRIEESKLDYAELSALESQIFASNDEIAERYEQMRNDIDEQDVTRDDSAEYEDSEIENSSISDNEDVEIDE